MKRRSTFGLLVGVLLVLAATGVAAQGLPPTKPIPNFEAVTSSLAVRLYPEDTYRNAVQAGVWKSDLEGVISVLVYDYPTHTELVPRSHANAWGISEDELFDLGVSNVRAKFAPTIESLEEYGIHFFFSDEVYVTTLLYSLDSFPQVIGRRGSLVSIPDRHTVVILPLDGHQTGDSSSVFINITLGVHFDSDSPISYHVWWYYQGEFTRADVIVGNSMYLLLPEFVSQE